MLEGGGDGGGGFGDGGGGLGLGGCGVGDGGGSGGGFGGGDGGHARSNHPVPQADFWANGTKSDGSVLPLMIAMDNLAAMRRRRSPPAAGKSIRAGLLLRRMTSKGSRWSALCTLCCEIGTRTESPSSS